MLFFIALANSKQHQADVFTIKNNQTGEVLAFYHKVHPKYNKNYKFIVRHPKAEEHWREVGETKCFSDLETPVNTIYLDIKKHG